VSLLSPSLLRDGQSIRMIYSDSPQCTEYQHHNTALGLVYPSNAKISCVPRLNYTSLVRSCNKHVTIDLGRYPHISIAQSHCRGPSAARSRGGSCAGHCSDQALNSRWHEHHAWKRQKAQGNNRAAMLSLITHSAVYILGSSGRIAPGHHPKRTPHA
jgi:hypothetical protein